MADEEMVRALAVRLSKMAEDLPYLDDFDVDENPAWSELAREVIRQIEWARRHPRALYEHPDKNSKIIGYAPPALAPDEWTVESEKP